MRSFSTRDMMPIPPRDYEDALALLHLQAAVDKTAQTPLLQGSVFTANSLRGHGRLNIYPTNATDKSGDIVDHIDIFYAAYLICADLRRSCLAHSKKLHPEACPHHLEVQASDPFAPLIEISFPYPRYNEIRVAFPSPVCCAPIPHAWRREPPFVMANKNMIVAYATEDSYALFATNVDRWKNTVKPSTVLQALIAVVKTPEAYPLTP